MNIVLLTFLVTIGMIIVPFIIGKIKEKILDNRYDIYECWLNGIVFLINLGVVIALSYLIAYLVLNYKQG